MKSYQIKSDEACVSDFLLELGVEELPAKLLKNILTTLDKNLSKQLHDHKLKFMAIKSFATPRRLAILITGLSQQQAQQNIAKKGPSIDAPEKAIQGFLKSVGLSSVKELTTQSQKNKTYYYYKTSKIGEKTVDLLPKIIENAIAAISYDKMMRWADNEQSFIRPVHWLVVLFGCDIVPMSVFSIVSGRTTQGLRFAKNNKINIAYAKDYEQIMQDLGIEPSIKKRQTLIKQQIQNIAQQNQVEVVIDKTLLAEVCALVEAPKAFIGQFDELFLSLPSEVLILTMVSNQRYFPVFDTKHNLVNSFIAVANKTDIEQDLSAVILGNERVIKPRLADAKFFWEQDKKTTLDTRLNLLKSVAFMQSLGSVFDKVKRLENLSYVIAQQLNTDYKLLQRAALLSKSDLVSNMVVEFPKLQGVMGGYYAKNDGEDVEVSNAISQHYYPRFSGDDLPNTNTAYLLSFLDKLDTITGIYGLGKIPTGSKDPYALRRLALGVVRIIIEKNLDFNLFVMTKQSLDQHNSSVNKTSQTCHLILDFILERLKTYYIEQNVSINIYNAISLDKNTYSLLDFHHKILALKVFNSQEQAKNLITLNKRIYNTLKDGFNSDNALKIHQSIQAVDVSLLTEEYEQKLFMQLEILQKNTSKNYEEIMLGFCTLTKLIDDFFIHILVNVEADNIKNNRLNLLGNIWHLFLSVADISKL